MLETLAHDAVRLVESALLPQPVPGGVGGHEQTDGPDDDRCRGRLSGLRGVVRLV
jgi:hypothetical protein